MHLLRLERVQPRGGLVAEEQARAAQQLHADAEPLALAAAQPARLRPGSTKMPEAMFALEVIFNSAYNFERVSHYLVGFPKPKIS